MNQDFHGTPPGADTLPPALRDALRRGSVPVRPILSPDRRRVLLVGYEPYPPLALLAQQETRLQTPPLAKRTETAVASSMS